MSSDAAGGRGGKNKSSNSILLARPSVLEDSSRRFQWVCRMGPYARVGFSKIRVPCWKERHVRLQRCWIGSGEIMALLKFCGEPKCLHQIACRRLCRWSWAD